MTKSWHFLFNQPHSFHLILWFLWIQKHTKSLPYHTTVNSTSRTTPQDIEKPFQLHHQEENDHDQCSNSSLNPCCGKLQCWQHKEKGEESALHQRDQFFWGVEGSEQCDIIRLSCVH